MKIFITGGSGFVGRQLVARLLERGDDVYALACIAYELITGKHPYNRLSAAQALENKIHPERPKALSARQWAALKKGLALKRSQRSKSVKDLL